MAPMPRPTTLCCQLFELAASVVLVALIAGSAAASQIGFVYSLEQVSSGANQIYGFRFEPGTGALTLLPGFPIASGGTGPASTTSSEHLAYVDGRLYAINDGDNTMTVFGVNRATGALTAMPYSPIALGTGTWTCVAVHPSGSPVVVGNSQGALASFAVSDTTAFAAKGSPYAATSGPISCAFSQDGVYVYGSGNAGALVNGFTVHVSTGVLTALAGSPFNAGGINPFGLTTDSSGRLFTAMLSAGEIRGFTTASGVPTALMGNPSTSGLTRGTHGVLRSARFSGFYGFYMVADRTGNRVGVYGIAGEGDTTTVSAISGSPFATGGTFTNALALTHDGGHLLAANGNSRNLTVFQIHPTQGTLTTVGVQAANALGTTGVITGLAFAQSEAGFVYALQEVFDGANQIHGFRINPVSGALTPLAGFPIASGGTGTGLLQTGQMAYRNGRLYVINGGSFTLSAFKVNRTTGSLAALPFSPIAIGSSAGNLSCVDVHPSGSPVVVGAGVGETVWSYDINATTATPAPGSPYSTNDARPSDCSFGHDGSYLYTVGGGGIAAFQVNAGTGALTPLNGSPFAFGNVSPGGFATDSSGRLFGFSIFHPEVRAFTTAAGVPTAVSGNPFASGLTLAIDGVRHPSGRYMVADRQDNRVGVYGIGGSGAGTTLSAIFGSPFASGGLLTHGLALTEDGTFLLAANGNSRNLTVFRVSPATGALTSIGVQAADTLGTTGRTNGIEFVPVVPPFIDEPLTGVPLAVIKAVHITELRTRIDAVRAQYGLGPYTYSDPTLTIGTTVVGVLHVNDLRLALAEVYTAIGATQPPYTDPGLEIRTTVVKRAHISELRAAVLAIE
jgi:6-phosphogluconolactonase